MRLRVRTFTALSWNRCVIYGVLAIFCFMLAKAYFSLSKNVAQEVPQTKSSSIETRSFGKSPLYLALKRSGIEDPELSSIVNQLKKVVNPREFRREDNYALSMSTAGVFQRLIVSHNYKRYYVAKVRGNRLVAGVINIPVMERNRTVAGVIKNSLWESMVSSGLSAQLVMEFADAFSWNIDFLTETRNGDKYSVVWNEKYTADGAILGQKILAAYYNGQETGKKKAFEFRGDYYDRAGDALQRMFLRAPLSYRRISSFFSLRRFHPVLRIFRPHLGIDYAAPSGTPISAVASGRIKYVGWKGGFGRYVEIGHDFGYVTSYGHMSKYARGAVKGAHVKQGEVIGYVGASGLASGPHLDFRIKQNGSFLNFLKMSNRASRGLDKKLLSEFKRAIENLDKQLDSNMDKF